MRAVELRVVSGPQINAGMTLPAGTSISVGGSSDDGVLLRDPSLDGRALRLQVEADSILVQVVSGTVIVNRTSLIAKQSLRFTNDVLLELGDTHLHLARAPSAVDAAQKPEQTDAYASDTASASIALDAGVHGATPPTMDAAVEAGSRGFGAAADRSVRARTADRRALPVALRAGSCVLGLSLLSLALTMSGVLKDADATATPDHSLGARLSTAGFDTLSVDTQARPVLVTGFLTTRAESTRLDAFLRQEPSRVRNRVTVGEELATRVQEVFRLNGVEAKVSVSSDGAAMAVTQVANEALLQRIAGQARRDIPQLAHLELSNTAPPPVAVTAPPLRELPGKRVAMIISDAPAHVITEDRSRYFVGSLLPSGHRITSIDAGRVSLVKAGQRTDLEF